MVGYSATSRMDKSSEFESLETLYLTSFSRGLSNLGKSLIFGCTVI